MELRRGGALAVEVGAAVVLVALLVGQVAGQPVLLGYVETGSMEPTLAPGDGFVAIPSHVAGDVEPGDVIVFEAEELDGGGLTTHRVVGETEQGYITRGDANPFTDQDDAEPPVKRAQIVAVAWEVGGEVVVIPGLGMAVEAVGGAITGLQTTLAGIAGTRSLLGPQGLAYLLFAVTVLAYALSVWRDDAKQRSRTRERETGTSGVLIVVGLMAVVAAGATAGMVGPSGSTQFDVISAESDSPGARVIDQGTSESVRYPVHNGGVVPTLVFVETTGGADVSPDRYQVGPRETVNGTLTLSAPPETGYYREFVTEHRYLALLPAPHIAALYEVHPLAPVVVIDGLVAAPIGILGTLAIGRGRIRSRERKGPSRLQRVVNRLT